MLKDRAIDDGQHLFWNRFGGREKSCSQSCDRKNCLADASGHQFPRSDVPRLFESLVG
jgi:hypothetical protein